MSSAARMWRGSLPTSGCNAVCPSTGTIELERDSVADLTGTLTGTNTSGYQGAAPPPGSLPGLLQRRPPAPEWVVLTFRAVPFGNQPETLSLAGTRQLTDDFRTDVRSALSR